MRWKKDLWPEWEIENSIGSGAYGVVYRIKRQDIGGIYYSALKVISIPQSNSEIERLRNANMSDNQIKKYFSDIVGEISKEVAFMEKFKGFTNIVSYEDHKIVSHADGLHWDVLIRMELLTPLTRHLETHTMDENGVCRLGRDICNALTLCEKEKIIHRDIKPGNIFISDYGDFKLGDFSLAKYVDIRSGGSSAHGTYSYMAPEVYKEIGYDSTIDIYSLGLILYRLMNRGRGPFQPLPPTPLSLEVSEAANQMRLKTETLPRPVDASAMMVGIIQKACAYAPEKRYRNSLELKEALERCMSLQPALNVAGHVSKLVKKAVDVFSGNEVADGRINEHDHMTNHAEEEKNNGSSAGQSGNGKKKTMKDFFTTAGDL